MSLDAKIIALAQAIGTDIKALNLLTAKQGDLSTLATASKTTLVAAINELHAALGTAGVQINDAAGDGATTTTWSADKIFDEIELAKTAVTNSLVNGAAAALDTLNELAAALGNDPNFATTIATALTQRVRVDAVQTFTALEQAQGRANLGAAAAADLAALSAAVGDTNRDFVADYTAAKA
ncbi:MAG: hypothetical protein ACT4NV_02980 [Rhodoferax sp.]